MARAARRNRGVDLPLPISTAPMEALSADELPSGREWRYEPKWDGFRCLAFRDGDDVDLRSKAGKPLARYFPDLVTALRACGARRFVLDGEIGVPVKGRLDFDQLLQRIHPAQSRVDALAQRSPALLIVFDLLVDERGRDRHGEPLRARRERLERFAARHFAEGGALVLSPATDQRAQALRWLRSAGASLDGVVAKLADSPYLPGERAGMVKVKRQRTADCVVGGFRYATKGRAVGSLLLGLHDDEGLLHHVGFTSSLPEERRAGLLARLEGLRRPPGFTGRTPGGPSRWSKGRSTAWEALAPELVVEVGYDHFTGGRFRHGARFLRWRPDKAPERCTFEQVVGRGGAALRLLRSAS